MHVWFHEHWRPLAALGVLLLSILLGIGVRATVFKRLRRFAADSQRELDDAIVESLRRPLVLWFALGGAHLASQLVEMSPRLENLAARVLAGLLVLSLTLFGADLSVRLLPLALPFRTGAVAPVAGVLRIAVRMIIFAVGALVLLSTLGISIAPVLATVGVGGLAVALGLQDTLASLFAGIHLILTGNIRVGDFVRLESGDEGFIEDIGWRATRVRTPADNTVVVPNSRIAQSVVTNYSQPAKEVAVTVTLGVHQSSDLEQVERVALEVAREVVATTPVAVRDFAPILRFSAFGASSIDFGVTMRAVEQGEAGAVKHAFIKAIARRFAAEGIVIPVPIRAINLAQEGAAGGARELATKSARDAPR
jgi:small-conductance mechanosensitive channel